ncbi:MAG: UvrD-helicase domain-containing protein, partial [archaeon]
IDEFQDTNPVQTEIIKLLAKKETVIGVIGDTAQSIFSFTGASVESFINFDLQGMILYKLENNHRSTKEIITVLNKIRKEEDFKQKSPEESEGPQPKILIDDFHDAYKNLEEVLDDEDFYTLSYTNNVVNKMKLKIEDDYDAINAEKLLEEDGCYHRKILIINVVKAVEEARDNNYQDAIKLLLKGYRKNEDFNEKDALKLLHKFVNTYDEFSKLTLKKFYNNYIHGNYQTDIFSNKIGSHGGPHELYSDLDYFELSLSFKLDNDNSFYRTIHKAKGDQFDNVLLVIPEDEKDCFINFAEEPDLENKEKHRRYYVALSRAKKKLFVNLPEINASEKALLSKIGFQICEKR